MKKKKPLATENKNEDKNKDKIIVSSFFPGILRGVVLLLSQYRGSEYGQASFLTMEHRAKSWHPPEVL